MTAQLVRHQFTVDDFYRMAEVGILNEDDRVELIEGEIVEMVPTGGHDAGIVDVLNDLFTQQAVRLSFYVRVQNPLRLNDTSEPVPDLTILPRPVAIGSHPLAPDVMLLIEVADSSLLSDRQVKMPLYARHGIPEAWIVNLTNNSVEVYREPSSQGFGSRHVVERGGHVTPLALPDLSVAVDDILPLR